MSQSRLVSALLARFRSSRSKLSWIAIACAALACGEPQSMDPVSRGKRVYRANCVVCHNLDPTREGGLGPAIAGSSPELLQARVLRREYPEGYTPKRDSAVMPAFPALKGEIDALAAYLASTEATQR